MPDIFNYAGEVQPNDIRLADPTQLRSGGAATTGTAAAVATKAVSAATGLEAFSSTAAGTAHAATSAATGLEVHSGTASATATRATAAATGEEAFTASAAGTARKATSSASGAQSFTATASAAGRAAQGSATGVQVFVGTEAGTAQAATGTGTGDNGSPAENTAGTGAATARPATAYGLGVGLIPVTGSGLGLLAPEIRFVSLPDSIPSQVVFVAKGAGTGRSATSAAQGVTKRYHNSTSANATARRASGGGSGLVDYEAQNEEELLLLL